MAQVDAEPPMSRIRDYSKDADGKELAILLGMSVFYRLPVANFQAYTHPVVLGVWIALSCVLVEFAGWRPSAQIHWLGVLSPLPAFASCALPIMFIIDWLQRPYFERLLRQTLTSEDIMDIEGYYYARSLSPFTRFQVLEWKGRPIGFIGIDASQPDKKLSTLEDKQSEKGSLPPNKAGGSPTVSSSSASTVPAFALIRHYYVDRVYLRSGVQYDLIDAALHSLFSSDVSGTKPPAKQVDRAIVRISSVDPEKMRTFKAAGFVPCTLDGYTGSKVVSGSKVWFGEKERWLEMTRDMWRSKEARLKKD